MYTGILNGQSEVLGEGKLVDITNADESGLVGQEGVGNLHGTVSIKISKMGRCEKENEPP